MPDSPICLENHYIARMRPEWLQPRFYGGIELPEGMTDHPGCNFCQPTLDYFRTKHALHPDNHKHPRAADANTQYAFTLTMPPDYQPDKPIEEVAKLIMEYGWTNGDKVNNPPDKACKFAYVLEHTDKGTPHVHGVYQTVSGRRIATKYFKRYWKIWDEKVHLGHGHKGGYHQKVRANESYEGYLEKEGVVIKSIA